MRDSWPDSNISTAVLFPVVKTAQGVNTQRRITFIGKIIRPGRVDRILEVDRPFPSTSTIITPLTDDPRQSGPHGAVARTMHGPCTVWVFCLEHSDTRPSGMKKA